MNGATWQIWRCWAIATLLAAAGCRSVLGPAGLPQDPLFLSHRPVEGRAANAAPIALAAVEPTVPPLPAPLVDRPALAQWRNLPDRVGSPAVQREPDVIGNSPRAAPGVLTNRPVPR